MLTHKEENAVSELTVSRKGQKLIELLVTLSLLLLLIMFFKGRPPVVVDADLKCGDPCRVEASCIFKCTKDVQHASWHRHDVPFGNPHIW